MGARWNSANKSPFASASQNRIRVIPQSRNAVDSSEPRNSSKLASPAYSPLQRVQFTAAIGQPVQQDIPYRNQRSAWPKRPTRSR